MLGSSTLANILLVGQLKAAWRAVVQSRAEAETSARRLAFLAKTSTTLASSLDYEATISSVARLIVPTLADWCTIHILEDDGLIRRLAATHIDPTKEKLVHDRPRRYPLAPNAQHIVSHVLRTGQPELYPFVTDEMLVAAARDPEHLQVMRTLGFTSYMCVPLLARGRAIGAITIVSANARRRYTQTDLTLAQELAHHAAIAIDNARLYREAQDAINMRDQFLSIASHELKTPLTAVLGFAELLQARARDGGIMSDREQRALHLLILQSQRLNDLVCSLLDISRMRTGQLSIDRKTIDLCAVARRVVDETQPLLEKHTVQIIEPCTPLMIQGDELRLHQALQNLVQNAIKYSPAGGPVIVQAEQRGDEACVTVIDTGIGIPAEALTQLFHRFYRAPNVAGKNITGMGIGLYVVKHIVNLHGGRVSVQSQEGIGSTFTICLPCLAEPSPLDHPEGDN